MDIELDLENLPKNKRYAFCRYICILILNMIKSEYNLMKGKALEDYINVNKVIKWESEEEKEVSVYELYVLYGESLEITTQDSTKFIIGIDENMVIPNSYTSLYSVISLLEYGTLSVRKYGLVDKVLGAIEKNISTLYDVYKLRGEK